MAELFGRLQATPGHKARNLAVGGDYIKLDRDVKGHFCIGTGADHPGCLALKKEVDEAYTQFFTNDRATYCLFGTVHKVAIVVIALFAAAATKSLCPTGMPFLVKAGSVCIGGLLFGALPATVAGVTHIRIACGGD